eukprot:175097-Pyramimonas_sp.AAC.1
MTAWSSVRSATRKSEPRQEWPSVRGSTEDAGWPNPGAHADAAASRSAIGGHHLIGPFSTTTII